MEYTKKEEANTVKKKPKKQKEVKRIAPIDTEKKQAYKTQKKKAENNKPLEVGDQVKIKGASQTGTILEFDRKEVIVSFGNLKTKTKLSNLSLAD